MKRILFSFALFCFMWQSSYSQTLSEDRAKISPEIMKQINEDIKRIERTFPEEKTRDRYAPPHDPDKVIISPEVEKWMYEQLAYKTSSKKTVKMTTDVLGRVKSRSNGIGIGQEKVVEDRQQKRLVRVSDMHIPQIEMEDIEERSEYNPLTKNYDYYINGKKMDVKEYENVMKKRNEERDRQYMKGKRSISIPGLINYDEFGWTALMTAEEISELVKYNKELAIGDYSKIETTDNIESVLSTIQLSTLGHYNHYEGNGIGIGVMEPDCRDTNIPIVDIDRYSNYCSGGDGTYAFHHSWVVNAVQYAAPKAHVYGFNANNSYFVMSILPTLLSVYPSIQIGTHSYCIANASDNKYSQFDMEMDNYIYSSGVTNFVSAGNNGNCGFTYDVSSPGKALNAITVGAVHSKPSVQNNYTNYSKWKNPDIGNEKPEIAMYTDLSMGKYSSNVIFNGTSASTPLAAGFTASLMERDPFFKRRPAAVKAVLLAGETIPIQNYSWDGDNSKSAKGIANFSSVAWGTRGRHYEGNGCFGSDEQIVFLEDNIQANKRYRIAISWLSEGTYILDNKRIQQDIDLFVYQVLPSSKLLASSTSKNNPFEIVDFVAESSFPLMIVIKRYRNSAGKDFISRLGYIMRENF